MEAPAADARAEVESARLLELVEGAGQVSTTCGMTGTVSSNLRQHMPGKKCALAGVLAALCMAALMCYEVGPGAHRQDRASEAGKVSLAAAQDEQSRKLVLTTAPPVAVRGAAKAVAVEHKAEPIHSGDTIHLRAHTDKNIGASGGVVSQAADGDDQDLVIEGLEAGAIANGDAVYVQAHNGKYVRASGETLRADADEKGSSERLVIRKSGGGAVMSGDTVYLQASTGMNIGVDADTEEISARFAQTGGWQELVILKKTGQRKCSAVGENCASSKCCEDAGMQCFAKDAWWSQCKASCREGPDPTDQSSPMPWSCEALGARTAGELPQCAADGEDCRLSKCCHTVGSVCYEKNETFARCKPSCEPGPDMTDSDWLPWSCKSLGPRKQGAAPWVAEKCAKGGEDCSSEQCCSEPGMQCYKKNAFWSECKATCTPGMKLKGDTTPWECTPVGMRTPEEAPKQDTLALTAPWAAERCVGIGENCSDSRCCLNVGAQCFRKDEHWAQCHQSCDTAPGAMEAANVSWSCEALGPKSAGLAIRGRPSLFCFSLMRVEGYEPDLMRAQLKESAGIFDCDGSMVLADGVISLGRRRGSSEEVKTVEIPKIPVGVSQDGTAANTLLFMKVWDKIIADGRFRRFDWTIKVDPDAVLLAWRLRHHMLPHTGQSLYVVNCNKFPGSPNFPMMYGALEVFSVQAMRAYAEGSAECGRHFWPQWKAWGEDYFMTHCMDFLGVGRIGDYGVLGDNMCTGANCKDTYTASFHPFKTIGGWMQCWGEATKSGV